MKLSIYVGVHILTAEEQEIVFVDDIFEWYLFLTRLICIMVMLYGKKSVITFVFVIKIISTNKKVIKYFLLLITCTRTYYLVALAESSHLS